MAEAGRARALPAPQALAEAEAAARAGKVARATGLLLRHVVATPGGDTDVQVRGFLLLFRLCRAAGRLEDAAGYARAAAWRAEQGRRPDLQAAVAAAVAESPVSARRG